MPDVAAFLRLKSPCAAKPLAKSKRHRAIIRAVGKGSLGMTLQAKQREQHEFEQRAARIQKLEARQKQEEAVAVKALSQQLLAHQVSLPSHQSAVTLLCHLVLTDA